MLFSIIGWCIVYLVSTRAIRRADITKARDACILCLEDCIAYLDKLPQLNSVDGNEVESKLSTFAFRIELRTKSLNQFSGHKLREDTFAALSMRRIDGQKAINDKEYRFSQSDNLLEEIGQIEIAYNKLFFQTSPIVRFFRDRRVELYGALLSLLVLTFTGMVLEIWIGN